MWRWVKQAGIAVLSPLARTITAGRVRILMYHRFGPRGAFRRMPMDAFDRQIRYVKSRYRIVPLSKLVAELEHGARVAPRTVVVTVDDGYRDFLEYAYPILARHQVPVTVYLVSEFVEQSIWLWFDAIHYLAHAAPAGHYDMQVGGARLHGKLDSERSRNELWEQIADVCLKLAPAVRDATIASCAAALGVVLPRRPTPEYAALTWDEVRSLDPGLVEIGVHTATHPVLSLCTVEEQQREITSARQRIESMLGRRVDAFCYPNGQPGDYSADTMRILRESGFRSAVLAHGGMLSARPDMMQLERIGSPVEYWTFRSNVDGVAMLRERLGGAPAPLLY